MYFTLQDCQESIGWNVVFRIRMSPECISPSAVELLGEAVDFSEVESGWWKLSSRGGILDVRPRPLILVPFSSHCHVEANLHHIVSLT